MPLTSLITDPEALTLTVVAEYPVPVQRLWDAYADPRQIEKFWGPVDWPATFTRHDFAVGGRTHYYMTGPDGERFGGVWIYQAVEPGKRFTILDHFADDQGAETLDLEPMHVSFEFEAIPGGSRMTSVTTFASVQSLEYSAELGMEEGLRSAMSQIDAVVEDLASFAAGLAAQAQLLSDTQVRVARIIRGTPQQVWRAHTDASLMQRWLLGPEGWTMPVCEIATSVGDSYRYEWEAVDGSGRFGFEGELLESQEPYRQVTTENMIGMEGPGTVNELTLTPVHGGTLLAIVITYATKDMRDMILATGMTDGMEASYSRMESVLA